VIRECVLFAAGIYLALTVYQASRVPGTLGESIAVGAILVLGATLYWAREKHLLERGEMLLVWSCILLFLVYTLLTLGGLL